MDYYEEYEAKMLELEKEITKLEESEAYWRIQAEHNEEKELCYECKLKTFEIAAGHIDHLIYMRNHYKWAKETSLKKAERDHRLILWLMELKKFKKEDFQAKYGLKAYDE